MAELGDADTKVVIDELRIRLSDYEDTNNKIIASGWSGTGAVGYAVSRLREIIAKLGG